MEQNKSNVKNPKNTDENRKKRGPSLKLKITATCIAGILIAAFVAALCIRHNNENAKHNTGADMYADTSKGENQNQEDEEEFIPESERENGEYNIGIKSSSLTDKSNMVTLRKEGTKVYINEEKCYAIAPEYNFVITLNENDYQENGDFVMITGFYNKTPASGDMIVYWDMDSKIHFGFVKSAKDADVIIDDSATPEFLDAIVTDITGESWAWE